MQWALHPGWLVAVMAMLPLATAGCRTAQEALTKRPGASRPPDPALEQPPPLHTGGLGVLTVDAETGRQGPDVDPTGHGDPVAEAIATGVGVMALGGGAAATLVACAQPGAAPDCLRGPSPVDNERPPPPGAILPLAEPAAEEVGAGSPAADPPADANPR